MGRNGYTTTSSLLGLGSRARLLYSTLLTAKRIICLLGHSSSTKTSLCSAKGKCGVRRVSAFRQHSKEDPLRGPHPHRAERQRIQTATVVPTVRKARPPYLAPVGKLVDVRSGHPGDGQAHAHNGEARENLEPHLRTVTPTPNRNRLVRGRQLSPSFWRHAEGAVPCMAQEEATVAAGAQK